MNLNDDPFPPRFANYEDAMKFMSTGNRSLQVPSHIWKSVCGTDVWIRNKAYDDAPYEHRFVLYDNVLQLTVPSSKIILEPKSAFSSTNRGIRGEPQIAEPQGVRGPVACCRNHTLHTHSESNLVRCGRPTLLP